MDEFTVLMEAIYRDEYDSRPDIGDSPLSRWDSAIVAVARINEMREHLHSLIAAAVGGGGFVNVPVYVHEHHGGDYGKAVKFACEVIAHSQQQQQPSEARGTSGTERRA